MGRVLAAWADIIAGAMMKKRRRPTSLGTMWVVGVTAGGEREMAIRRERETGRRKPGEGNREKETGRRKPGEGNREKETGRREVPPLRVSKKR
ncbi:MAG: hypothetical protein WBF09_09300 [Candidatus Acidiferrum sp.]